MTKKEAVEEFDRITKGSKWENDKPAMREAWSHYIDMLHRDGEITDKQANNWIHPKFH